MSCPWPLDAAFSRSQPAMRPVPPARCGSNRRATRLCSASASLPNPRILSSPCIGGQDLSPTPFPPCWQWVTPILRPWFHCGWRIPGCPSPGARHTAGTPVFAPGILRAARRAAPDAKGRYHYSRAEVGVPVGRQCPEAEFPLGEVVASLNERGKANRQERPPRRGGLAQQRDLGRGRGIPRFALRAPHSAARQGFGSAGTGGGNGAGEFIARKHDNLTNRPEHGGILRPCGDEYQSPNGPSYGLG